MGHAVIDQNRIINLEQQVERLKSMAEAKPLTSEEFAAILWPGMFKPGWRDQDPSSAFYQAECYCLQKTEKMLETIEVRRKTP